MRIDSRETQIGSVDYMKATGEVGLMNPWVLGLEQKTREDGPTLSACLMEQGYGLLGDNGSPGSRVSSSQLSCISESPGSQTRT